jgi:hypothetical protein
MTPEAEELARLREENAILSSQSTYHEREAERWKAMLRDEEAENARLRAACKPLAWSRETPTEPGHYWWRADDLEEGRVFKVWKSSSGILFYQDLEVGRFDGEWSGPIPQPTVSE